ncbi:hypothetical protein ABT173_18655 [Streptomyces sp. NPDC001795]|uniref:hypothetical protein n=2 Tax=unclassified Streptomyces TaxID=2593676 RepID=UPI00331E93C1
MGVLPSGSIFGLEAPGGSTASLSCRVLRWWEAVIGLRVMTLLLRFRCAGVVPAFAVATKGLPLMRVTRTMFASAAVAAAVAFSAPAAHAVSVAELRASDGGTSYGSEGHEGQNGKESKEEGHGHGHGQHKSKPRGGVRAGGGALSMTRADDGDWSSEEDEQSKGSHHGGSEAEEGGRGGEEKGEDSSHGGEEGGRGGEEKGEDSSHGGEEGGRGGEEKGEDSGRGGEEKSRSGEEGARGAQAKKPRGGVHAGGGGLAQSGNGLAAGSVLLLGGLGAGAYMLRRRGASGAARA